MYSSCLTICILLLSVSSPNLLPSIYLPSLLYPHHPSNGMSSVLNSQKHPTVIHMQHLYKINQLHGIRLLLQKLTVAHLLKEFPTFHENEISLLNHINPAYRSMMMECNWLDILDICIISYSLQEHTLLDNFSASIMMQLYQQYSVRHTTGSYYLSLDPKTEIGSM